MELKIFTKSELLDYCLSAEYKSSLHVSITQHRANSYFHNPRGDHDDIVMVHAYDGEILVGYLGILPDYIERSASKDTNFERKTFGWLSCIWVHSEYQGKGVAKVLLTKVAEKWNGKMLATEFIPGLKKMYLQSGYFESSVKISGIRIYFGSTMEDWIPRKFPSIKFIKPFFGFCDRFINQLFLFRYGNIKWINNWENANFEDPALKEFISQCHQPNPFKRSVDEFKWMTQYPWVLQKSDSVSCNNRYYFTSCANKFSLEHFILRKSNGEIQIYIQLLKKDFCLTVNYLFLKDQNLLTEVYALISDFVLKNMITVLKIFGNQNSLLFVRRLPGELIRRKVVREYLLSEAMLQFINQEVNEIQAGDGDCGFT